MAPSLKEAVGTSDCHIPSPNPETSMRNIVLALIASMTLLAGCAPPRFQDGDVSMSAPADPSVQPVIPVDTDPTIARR
jgi:hypothetical protein